MIHLAKDLTLSVAGFDMAKAFVVSLDEVPWEEMAFDHAKSLSDYLKYRESHALLGIAIP